MFYYKRRLHNNYYIARPVFTGQWAMAMNLINRPEEVAPDAQTAEAHQRTAAPEVVMFFVMKNIISFLGIRGERTAMTDTLRHYDGYSHK